MIDNIKNIFLNNFIKIIIFLLVVLFLFLFIWQSISENIFWKNEYVYIFYTILFYWNILLFLYLIKEFDSIINTIIKIIYIFSINLLLIVILNIWIWNIEKWENLYIWLYYILIIWIIFDIIKNVLYYLLIKNQKNE